MQRLVLLALVLVFGCATLRQLPHGGPVERLGNRQCGRDTDEINARMVKLEKMARSGGSKMALYEEIQSVRGDIAVAKGKCNDDREARTKLETFERSLDSIEKDFVLQTGSPG